MASTKRAKNGSARKMILRAWSKGDHSELKKTLESKDSGRKDIEGNEADRRRPPAESAVVRIVARPSPVTGFMPAT